MKRILIVSIFLMALAESAALAQQAKSSVEIDYNQPKTYVVGGIKVSGNRAFAEQQIINQSGLRKGMSVTVPSEDISAVVNRLWLQRYFQDVAVYVDSIAPSKDTAFFRIDIQERPRVSVFNFTGVKSGEKKDLLERLNFRRGSAFSDYVSKTSVDII